MPRLQKPEKLESLALQATGTWICQLGRNLIPIISWISKTESQKASGILQQNIHHIHNIVAYNMPPNLFDRLSDVIFKKIPNLIEAIKRTLKTHSSMGEYLLQVNVAISLGEILISPHLHRLDFENMPKMMRQLFYTKLKELPGLRYLNMSTLSGGWKTEDVEPIILNGIVNMKNLNTLILTYDCTDEILKSLEKVCPKLQSLDISSSKLISNNSVKYLLEFHHLKNIQLYRTSITIDGYIRLLINMPSLEDIGRYNGIGTCLEYIDMTYQQNIDRPALKLKNYSSRYCVSKHLKLLSQWCPDIEKVSIFHNALLNNLMGLITINKLCNIHLLSCDFYQDHVRDIVEVKGCNLTILNLEHVDNIDINALMAISQYCPDLRELVIYNCELVDNHLRYFKKIVPPFMNLEKLTLASTCSLTDVEFILKHSLKIKFIHLGTMVPTTDELFDQILIHNPLQHLEVLRIIYSTDLTICTAYKLIDNCENLKILNDLDSWIRVQEYELDGFKIFLRTRNYAIDIKSYTWKTLEEMIEIDLTSPNLRYDSKFYQRVKFGLTILDNYYEQLNDDAINFKFIWSPPENSEVCPSSIAKYFYDLGHTVELCQPKVKTNQEHGLKFPKFEPNLKLKNEVPFEFIEYLGMCLLSCDIEAKDDDILNSFRVYGETEPEQIAKMIHCKALHTVESILNLKNTIKAYLTNSQIKLWIGINVCGYRASPINFYKHDHNYTNNGDNDYLILFYPNNKYFLYKNVVSNKILK